MEETWFYKAGLAPKPSGSLDNPPIIVHQDQAKTLFFCILIFALVPFFVLLARHGFQARRSFYLAGMWSVLGIISTWTIFRPARIVIDQQGIAFKRLGRLRRYDWADCADFRIRERLMGLVSSVAIVPPSTDRVVRPLPISLGSLWELDADDLLKLLFEARARWAGPQPAANAQPE